MALISIIVPVYNAQATLGRCVESILSQTHTDLELILVDDGSTDGSAALLNAYALKDPRIRVIHTENRGVSAARNTGLELARGAYTGFADADDRADADMYRRLHGLIEQEQADIAVCGYHAEHTGGQPASPIASLSEAVRVLSAKQAYQMALAPDGFQGFLWNKLFKSSFFTLDGHGIRLDTSLHICEDLLCFCTCLCKAEKIVWDPVPLYHYTVTDNSAGNSVFSVRKTTLLDARRKLSKLTWQNFPDFAGRTESLYVTDAVYIFILALHARSGTSFINPHIKYIRRHIVPYLFDKTYGFKYKSMALALCISPRAARALWRLLRGGKSRAGGSRREIEGPSSPGK